MNFSGSTLAASAVLAVVCSVSPSLSMAQTGQSASPDNSGMNADHKKTADNQPNSSDDRLTTAKVRKAIIADKELSSYAHNIKIITMNGKVTLKGPVKSEEEKQRITSDVANVIPAENVTNQLTVKP
ncbi:MAG TPA: BON domain-containing protein [Edaphobacter sp.]|nr:BON domain-containing protein [Edaphobacter sp.]